jgi:hypothetical protein
MFLFLVDGNRDLDDPTDRTRAGLFRGFILRISDVGAASRIRSGSVSARCTPYTAGRVQKWIAAAA